MDLAEDFMRQARMSEAKYAAKDLSSQGRGKAKLSPEEAQAQPTRGGSTEDLRQELSAMQKKLDKAFTKTVKLVHSFAHTCSLLSK